MYKQMFGERKALGVGDSGGCEVYRWQNARVMRGIAVFLLVFVSFTPSGSNRRRVRLWLGCFVQEVGGRGSIF